MIKLMLGLFALACILMMLGYELKIPSFIITGIILWTIIVVIVTRIGWRLNQ